MFVMSVYLCNMPIFNVKRRLQLACFIISAIGILATAVAKPTISFSSAQRLPGIPSLQQFIEQHRVQGTKVYSGKRLSNMTLIMIYHHESTVAVTELGPEKQLLGCELIEIYNNNEEEKLLTTLSKINRPLRIKFNEMIRLMQQCEQVDKLTHAVREANSEANTTMNSAKGSTNYASNILPRNPFSIFSGIIPGTKWCGTGDIANTYHDLGAEIDMDRCCRQHDLCPIKLYGYQQRYKLTNDALFTKSHCTCDDVFFDCLKKVGTSAAQFMSSIYFKVVQVPCLENDNDTYRFRSPKEGF